MALDQNEISSKSRLITLLLSFLLVHRFYVGKVVSGIFFFLTLGGFGIWWLIDIIQIISGSFKDQYGKFVNNWEADKTQLAITGGLLAVLKVERAQLLEVQTRQQILRQHLPLKKKKQN